MRLSQFKLSSVVVVVFLPLVSTTHFATLPHLRIPPRTRFPIAETANYTTMTENTDNATMEDLADDALNEFDMKYDGPEEDNSPRKSAATNLDNQTAGGKESEGKNVEVGDGKDDNATQEEDRWDDEAKSGENDEEGNDLEVDVGQKSEIDQATESGGDSGVQSNSLWGLSNVNDPYGAFKLQDKTPQELAEEAAQQQAVGCVCQLRKLYQRQNMVVQVPAAVKNILVQTILPSQTSIKDNENLDGNVDQGKSPNYLFALNTDNVTTILADKTDDGMTMLLAMTSTTAGQNS